MTKPAAARSFLTSEAETLDLFGFVAAVPNGHGLHVVEITRAADGGLEVRVPGRPRAVVPLEGAIRSALRERGFKSEDPTDQTKSWARSATDAEAAVALLQSLHTEVFGEKCDAPLDIGHGSHRIEHEVNERLAVARTRIEAIVTKVIGRRPEQDADLDYILPIGEVHVTVAPRAGQDGQVVIRVFAITNVAVGVTPELGLFLARLNFGLMFGRFALDAVHQSIWFDESLLGEQFREEELQFAIRMVASTADEWDDRLKQMFGGATHQEALASQAVEAPPLVKPGAGAGQYL